jgi:ketosteroid isomerase-like protein
MDTRTVQNWLNTYIHAWKTYDPHLIANLFSEDAIYIYHPFQEPLHGREAIVAFWLLEPDAPDTYDAHYEPMLVEGDRAVAHGRSLYFEQDGATLKLEWDNLFVLRFDAEGRCKEYREWYMQRPGQHL